MLETALTAKGAVWSKQISVSRQVAGCKMVGREVAGGEGKHTEVEHDGRDEDLLDTEVRLGLHLLDLFSGELRGRDWKEHGIVSAL